MEKENVPGDLDESRMDDGVFFREGLLPVACRSSSKGGKKYVIQLSDTKVVLMTKCSAQDSLMAWLYIDITIA